MQNRRLLVESLESRHLLAASCSEGISQHAVEVDPCSIEASVQQAAFIAVDDSFQLLPDRDTYVLDVLANDSLEGLENPVITDVVTTSSSAGYAEISPDGRSLTYHRPRDVFGGVGLEYVVGDQELRAAVRINFPSPVQPDSAGAVQNGPAVVVDVIANDPFWEDYEGERKITELSKFTAGGTAEILEDGRSIRFTADGSTGNQIILYVVDDLFPTFLQVSVVPALLRDNFALPPNADRTELDVLQNDFVPRSAHEHDVFIQRITSVTQSSSGAKVTIADDQRTVFYTPVPGFLGNDFFSYLVDDVHVGHVQVGIEDPFRFALRNDLAVVNQGHGPQTIDVLENDFRRHSNYTGPRKITSVSDVEGAIVLIAEDGSHISFEALDNSPFFNFQYTVDDKYSAAVTVPQQLVAGPYDHLLTYSSNEPMQIDIVDEFLRLPPNYEGPGLISSVTLLDSIGAATISSDRKSIVYTPGLGREEIQYVIDDLFENTILLGPFSWLAEDFATTQQERSTQIDVLANDFATEGYEGNRQITSVSSRSGNMEVTISDGLVVVVPKAGVFGVEYVDYVVDEVFGSELRVEIEQVIADDQFSYPQDSSEPIALNVLQNDGIIADYFGALQITEVIANSDASIEIADDGKALLYRPAAGFTGVDQFVYVVDELFSAKVDVHVDPDIESLFPKLSSFEDLQQIVLERGDDGRDPRLSDFVTTGVQPSSTGVHFEAIRKGLDTILFAETEMIVLRADEDGPRILYQLPLDGLFASYHQSGDLLAIVTQSFAVVDVVEADRETDPKPALGSDRSANLTILDISNLSTIKQLRRMEFDGQYIHSWLDDSIVHVALRSEEIHERIRLTPECETPAGFCREDEAESRQRIETRFGTLYQDLAPQFAAYDERGHWVLGELAVLPEDFIDPRSKPGRFDEVISSVAVDLRSSAHDLHAATSIVAATTSQFLPGEDNRSFYIFESFHDSLPAPFGEQEQKNPQVVISKYRFDPVRGTTQMVGSTLVAGELRTRTTPFELDGLLHVAIDTQQGTFQHILRETAGALEGIAVLPELLVSFSNLDQRIDDRVVQLTATPTGEIQFRIVDFQIPGEPQAHTHAIPFLLPRIAAIRNIRHEWLDSNHVGIVAVQLIGPSTGLYAAFVFDVSDAANSRVLFQQMFESRGQMGTTIRSAFPHLDFDQLLALPNGTNPDRDTFFMIDNGLLLERDTITTEIYREYKLDSLLSPTRFADAIDRSLHVLQDQAVTEFSRNSGVPADKITVTEISRESGDVRIQLVVDSVPASITFPFVEEDIGEVIEGVVYLDANNDAAFDETKEAPISGVTVRLAGRDWQGNALRMQTTTTDFLGRYQFNVSKYGDYQILQEQPLGYLNGKETPDYFFLDNLDDDSIDTTVASAQVPFTSLRTNNFGERGFDTNVAPLPENFAYGHYYTLAAPTLYRIPVSKHGTNLQLRGDAIFYVFDELGNVVAIRDGSGTLATLGADLVADRPDVASHYRSVLDVSERVELFGTGEAKEYFVSITPKPGSLVVTDLEISATSASEGSVPKLEQRGNQVTLVGTTEDDIVDVELGFPQHIVRINDFAYSFDAQVVNEIHVGGAQGSDQVTVHGGGFDDTGHVLGSRSTLRSNAYSVFTYSFEQTELLGNDGDDQVQLFGSTDDDKLESIANSTTTLTTPNYTYSVQGFERVNSYGRGGNDVARLYGTLGSDTFAANNDHAWLRFDAGLSYAKGFERVDAHGRGGTDVADFQASASRNRFVSTPQYASLTDEIVLNVARGFELIRVHGRGDNDAAYLFSSDAHSIFRPAPILSAAIERSDRNEVVFDFKDLFVLD